MFKNTATQQWVVFAFEGEGGTTPGAPVTGDAANITANVRIDAGAANGVDDVNPTELEDGYYSFGITAAESNGDSIVITPVSSTANVSVIGVPGAVYTREVMRGTDGANTVVPDAAGVAPTAAEIETEVWDALQSAHVIADSMGAIATELALIDTATMRGTDGANTVVPDAAGVAATPAEVATALTDIHLDHLLAADYDPATPPGVATALLNEIIESDVGVSRFTVNALENGPSGSGASAAAIADAVWDEPTAGHVAAGSFGKTDADILADTNELQGDDVPGLIAALNDAPAAPTAAANADAVWDELITGASHNTATSAGRRLRTLQESGSVYNGQVWLDTINGTAGTTAYENGTSDNHVNLLASAKTIAAAVGLADFHIINGSTVTLAESTVNESYFGDNWNLALGSQDIAGAHFEGAAVSGIGTSTSTVGFEGCSFGTASIQKGHFDFCQFSDTVTHTLAGDYAYHNCYSGVAGAGSPTFAKTAGQAVTIEYRNWSGGITFSGLQVGDTLTVSGQMGTIDLGSPTGATVVEIRGIYKEITNVGSAVVDATGAVKGSDLIDVLTDTADIQPKVSTLNADSAAGDLGVNVDKINDVVVTGDGSTTPFDVV